MNSYDDNYVSQYGKEYPSHAGYEVLEGDIIRRLVELKDLPEEDKDFELQRLIQEIYDANGGQYGMDVIEDLIYKNKDEIWRR